MPQTFATQRKSPASRPPRPPRRFGAPGTKGPAGVKAPADKAEHEILFQTYFKSVGPRTYAAQVKKANNGNHYLVLTEGKRDEATGEVRKARLFVYSEDFVAFFGMLQDSARFIKANPLPEEVKQKRDKFWAKKASDRNAAPAASTAPRAIAAPKPMSPAAAPSLPERRR
jgi:hypothetical protein